LGIKPNPVHRKTDAATFKRNGFRVSSQFNKTKISDANGMKMQAGTLRICFSDAIMSSQRQVNAYVVKHIPIKIFAIIATMILLE
jgi:hypothetical protein